MPLVVDNLPEAIRETKRTLRAALPNYAEVFQEVEGAIRQQVDAIRRDRDQGRDAIPVLDYASIVTNDVDPRTIENIKTRGACVIRRVFDPKQASDWNDEIADYVQRNNLDEKLAHRAEDKYFGTLSSSKPQIYGVYWSKPQTAARQSRELTQTRVFLNRLWRSESEGKQHFDPEHVPVYADRIRRRPPGSESLGLSPHVDGGSVERWLDPNFRQVYRHALSGNWREYDPFDAAFRPDARKFRHRRCARCSAPSRAGPH